MPYFMSCAAKCSCATAQLHVACSDFKVGLHLLGHWWFEVKSLQNLIYLFLCAFFKSTSNFYIVCKEIFFASALFSIIFVEVPVKR